MPQVDRCVYKDDQKETDEEVMQKIQWVSQSNWLNMKTVQVF